MCFWDLWVKNSNRVIRALTQPPTLLPFGEIFEAIGSAALGLLVLLDVPREFGGDVGDEVAAGPQTVIMAPHSELAVLRGRHKHGESLKAKRGGGWLTIFGVSLGVQANKSCSFSFWSLEHSTFLSTVTFFSRLPTDTPPLSHVCTPPSVCEALIPKDWAK